MEASNDFFKLASEVVNDVLLNDPTEASCTSLPRFDSLQRTANRTQQQLWVRDPSNLEFELEEEHTWLLLQRHKGEQID